MRFTYTPEGDDPTEFSFKPRRLFSFDSEAIEEVGGQVWSNWDGFLLALSEEKGRALRAALWHHLKQSRPEITFAQVVVHPGEVRAFYDDEEIEEMRVLASDSGTPESVRQAIWDALGKGDEAEASEISEPDTDSTSPTTASEG